MNKYFLPLLFITVSACAMNINQLPHEMVGIIFKHAIKYNASPTTLRGICRVFNQYYKAIPYNITLESTEQMNTMPQSLSSRIESITITNDDVALSPQLPNYLSKLNHLTNLDLSRSSIDGAALRAIAAACPHLTTLNLRDCINITKNIETMTPWPSLKNLRTLNLEDSSIDGAAIRAITASCPQLTTLNLGNTSIDGAALRAITETCPNLTTLSLRYCKKITTNIDATTPWPLLNHLTTLNLAGSSIDGAALRAITAAFPHLIILNFEGCNNIMANIDTTIPWPSLNQLINLNFRGTSINGTALRTITKAYPQLTTLTLGDRYNIINIDTSWPLLNHLTTLNLHYSSIDGAILRAISAKYPHLTTLNLQNCKNITTNIDTTIPWPLLDHLTTLIFNDTDIDGAALRAISAACPNLITLSLPFCDNIMTNINTTIPWPSLKHLTTLDLRLSPIDGAALRAIIAAYPHLTTLKLDCCRDITKNINTVDPWPSLNHLSQLNLGNSCIDGAALRAITTAGPNITTLSLEYCKNLTKKDIQNVLPQLPRLQTLNENFIRPAVMTTQPSLSSYGGQVGGQATASTPPTTTTTTLH